MISVDPEASKEFIKAGRDVFMSFGSTRLLGFALLILGVGVVIGSTTTPSMELLLWGLAVIAVGFLLLVVSYVLRPHDSKPRQPDQPK